MTPEWSPSFKMVPEYANGTKPSPPARGGMVAVVLVLRWRSSVAGKRYLRARGAIWWGALVLPPGSHTMFATCQYDQAGPPP